MKVLVFSLELPCNLHPALPSLILAVTIRELTASHISPASFNAAVAASSNIIPTPSFLSACSLAHGSCRPECRRVNPPSDHTSPPKTTRFPAYVPTTDAL